jgi:carboxylesterase type B
MCSLHAQITTDRLFVLEAVRAAKLQAAVNSAPVYFYQFGYRGTHSISEEFSQTTTNLGMTLNSNRK